MPTRNEACLLKRLARGDIRRTAARPRDTPLLVRDSLQLLHQVTAQASSAKHFSDLHINISIRPVVMKQDAAGRRDAAFDFEHPIPNRLDLVRKNPCGITRGCTSKNRSV